MDPVKETIMLLDQNAANFGFSNDQGYSQDFGLANRKKMEMMKNSPTNYSVNPAIQNQTRGSSTFKVNVTVKQTAGGAVDTELPIFLFGGKAFTNAKSGYTAVSKNNQITSLGFVNGKNVLIFKYVDPADSTKFTEYFVTLGTDGEYPYVLNSVADRPLMVNGVQIEISDVSKQQQLTRSISKFFIDEFGKSSTNDLTTPKDLYQQASNGIFLPHKFKISGDDGIVTNVLNVDAFSVDYFFFAERIAR